jgi:hypothetical protein
MEVHYTDCCDEGLPQTVVMFLILKSYNKTSRIKKRKFVPTEIVTYVLDFVDEFNKSQPNDLKQFEGKWEPAYVDELKMNVDAGCFDDG